jgi:hypothetical protein
MQRSVLNNHTQVDRRDECVPIGAREHLQDGLLDLLLVFGLALVPVVDLTLLLASKRHRALIKQKKYRGWHATREANHALLEDLAVNDANEELIHSLIDLVEGLAQLELDLHLGHA